MNTILAWIGALYPYSFLALLLLFSIWFIFDVNKLKIKILNIILFLSALVYFASFFSHYPIEWFMIVWFLRDLAIFTLFFKFWELFFRFKIVSGVLVAVLAVVFGYLYYKNGKLPNILPKEKTEFVFEPSAELLFELYNLEQMEQLKLLLKDFNPEIIPAFPHLKDSANTTLDNCFTINLKDSIEASKVKKILDDSKIAVWVEYNETIEIEPINVLAQSQGDKFTCRSLNDLYVLELWAFKYMDIDNFATQIKKKSPQKKARIFILDTGVDSRHEDLKDNYISLSAKYDSDTQKHGTHCAGIACAVSNNKIGIASLNLNNSLTSITSITVLPKGRGTQEAIIDGILLAADQGADVISMSLGGKSTDLSQIAYNKAIEYANYKGAIVVVAAGNSNENAKFHVPAACKNVITVAAVDEKLNKATFSNLVNEMEYKLSAPGVNIYSTVPKNQYEKLSGTSMATPYVASILGILKAFNPDLTTQEAFELLSETGMETQNTAATGKLIQPYKALQKLKKPTGKSLVMSFLRKTIYY